MTSVVQKKRIFIKEMLKGAAPYFMTGNALVNAETSPVMTASYGAAFLFQAAASYVTNFGEKIQNPTLKFMAGRQGALATNAAITLVVGATTFAIGGSALLGGTALAFGTANMVQALIYGGKLKFKKPIMKNFALAACEVGMIGGFLMLGAHVGLGITALGVIAGVGVGLASVRSFRPQAIHPDLAYADMLVTAGMTFAQALITPHHALIAASRVLAIAGVSRLAVQRAKNDGKKSIFEVENWVPQVAKRIGLSLGLSNG